MQAGREAYGGFQTTTSVTAADGSITDVTDAAIENNYHTSYLVADKFKANNNYAGAQNVLLALS